MAIAVDSTSEALNTTVAHTVSGLDRVLVAVVHTNGGTCSGVTYNGDALTLILQIQTADTAINSYLYYISNPDTGTNNLVATTSATNTIIGGISFTGAHTADPIGATQSSVVESALTSISVTVDTEGTNGYVVDLCRAQQPITVDGSQTRFVTQNSFNGNRSAGASYESFTGGSSVAMDWTFASSNVNLLMAVEVKELVQDSFTPLITMF